MSVDSQIAARAVPEYRALGIFLRGCGAAFTSVLAVTFVGMYMGFGALAHDTGFSAVWACLASMLIFAIPSQILVATGISHGALPLEIAVSVALTAVRFVPMVATLLPLMKSPEGRTRHVVFPAHCLMVTLWVEALRLLPELPRERRVCARVAVGHLQHVGLSFRTPA